MNSYLTTILCGACLFVIVLRLMAAFGSLQNCQSFRLCFFFHSLLDLLCAQLLCVFFHELRRFIEGFHAILPQ